MKKLCITTSILMLFGGLFISCDRNGKALTPVGILENATTEQKATELVVKALETGNIDDRFENTFTNKEEKINVWSLLSVDADHSTEGFGIVVTKGATTTKFPDIRHGNQPKAFYDAASSSLWVIGADMEGTGVLVERPHLMKFDNNDKATIASTIAPYDVQQELMKHLTYTLKGDVITFFSDHMPLATAVNSLKDMGDLADKPVCIGEQIFYEDALPLTVNIIPGLRFKGSEVIFYDDMPTLKAQISYDGNNITLTSFHIN